MMIKRETLSYEAFWQENNFDLCLDLDPPSLLIIHEALYFRACIFQERIKQNLHNAEELEKLEIHLEALINILSKYEEILLAICPAFSESLCIGAFK